ncbi:MAG: hypothetical protein ACTIH8_02530, partial [Microbacterium gubbeenense]
RHTAIAARSTAADAAATLTVGGETAGTLTPRHPGPVAALAAASSEGTVRSELAFPVDGGQPSALLVEPADGAEVGPTLRCDSGNAGRAVTS